MRVGLFRGSKRQPESSSLRSTKTPTRILTATSATADGWDIRTSTKTTRTSCSDCRLSRCPGSLHGAIACDCVSRTVPRHTYRFRWNGHRVGSPSPDLAGPLNAALPRLIKGKTDAQTSLRRSGEAALRATPHRSPGARHDRFADLTLQP